MLDWLTLSFGATATILFEMQHIYVRYTHNHLSFGNSVNFFFFFFFHLFFVPSLFLCIYYLLHTLRLHAAVAFRFDSFQISCIQCRVCCVLPPWTERKNTRCKAATHKYKQRKSARTQTLKSKIQKLGESKFHVLYSNIRHCDRFSFWIVWWIFFFFALEMKKKNFLATWWNV